MRKGLVLEGGAMRGLFTAGILDVFMENGITFDGAVGVSAGACFGVNLKSHQIGRSIRYNRRFCDEWRYRSYRSLMLTGDLYGADFCYHELPDKLDLFDTKTFADDPMEFYAVATDCVTGKPVYHKMSDGGYEDLEWIRASASMPLASRVVRINDKHLLDGGITDSIPLEFMEKQGYEKNVVILTQPVTYVKHAYKKVMPLIKASLHRYPNTIERIKTRHIMYNGQTTYVKVREESGDAFVIRPPESLGIGALEKDPLQMQRVYDIGRNAGLKNLDAVKAFLSDQDNSTPE
jgi:predicted patatin/cPLA2 family phospholipase